MLNWKKIGDELPQDEDKCLLYGESGAMQGPIHWSSKHGSWVDLFFGPMSTKEGGTIVSPDMPGLTHWAIVNEPDNPQ